LIIILAVGSVANSAGVGGSHLQFCMLNNMT
jgi:hypothetical protein